MVKKDIPPGLVNALLNGFDAVAFRDDFQNCAQELLDDAPGSNGHANALMAQIDVSLTKRDAPGFDNGNPEHVALANGLDAEFGILRAIVAELRGRINGQPKLEWASAVLISQRLDRIVRAGGI